MNEPLQSTRRLTRGTEENAEGSSASQSRVLRALAFAYRYAVSPLLHSTQRTLTGSVGACRFQPSCSEYASLACHVHGPYRGTILALRRVLRCHPFARGGFDPVPAGDPTAARPAGHLP